MAFDFDGNSSFASFQQKSEMTGVAPQKGPSPTIAPPFGPDLRYFLCAFLVMGLTGVFFDLASSSCFKPRSIAGMHHLIKTSRVTKRVIINRFSDVTKLIAVSLGRLILQ